MVADEPTGVDPQGAAQPIADGEMVQPVTEAGVPKPGFMSTSQGKIIVIGAAVGVLLVILAVVAALVLMFLAPGKGTVATAPSPGAASAPATGVAASTDASSSEIATSAGESVPATVQAPISNASVFTFRDPFVPLIKLVSVVPSSTGATISVAAGTLVLQDIVWVNGKRNAVLYLDGQTYTLGATERVGTTPWEVLTVNSGSVVMLYGDTQVTLAIGEGIDNAK